MEQTKSQYDRAMAEADEAAAIALERQIATAVERMRAEMKAQWDAERAELTAVYRTLLPRTAVAAAAP